MADEKRGIKNQEAHLTLTDDQIVTERKVPRRSFLTAAGTLLAGGAAALVSGSRTLAQDAEKKEGASDPDSKKGSTKKSKKDKSDKKTKKPKKDTKESDPDSKK